jgi:hypothetical protein
MLLKRLDVTMQSFAWSKQVQGKEEEVLAAISAQRSEFKDEPVSYTVCIFFFNFSIFLMLTKLVDAIGAPISLAYEHSKRVDGGSGQRSAQGTASKRLSHSLVKTIIIGSVPDRGGRVSQTKPKSFSTFGGGGSSFGNRSQYYLT